MPPTKPPKPDGERVNRHALKYPWVPAPAEPWAGEVPTPPSGLLKASRDTWDLWFGSWWSGHWTEADLPGLRMAIRLFDRIERGREERGDRSELRQMMKSYGLSPEGRQALRWEPPKAEAPAPAPAAGSEDELARRRERLEAARAAGG